MKIMISSRLITAIMSLLGLLCASSFVSRGVWAEEVATPKSGEAGSEDPSETETIGTVVLRTSVGAEVWIGDRHVGNAPGNVLVSAGQHSLQLRAEGYLSVQREIEVVSGQRLELEFTLERTGQRTTERELVIEQTRLPPAFFWVGVTASFVSAAVATGLGSWALSMRRRVQEMDPRRRIQEDLDRINRVAVLTDVFWGIGGALAFATVIVGVMTDWGDRDGEPEVRRVWFRPAALGSASGSIGVSLGGSL